MQIPMKNDEGTDVVKLQAKLNELGARPKLTEDGVFGPLTEKAVSIFQKSIGLFGSGKIGPKTMRALGFKITAAPEPEPYTGPINREIIVDKIVSIIQKDVDNRLRERGGKNRGKRIDEFNRRAKSYLGAPYCASGLWCAVDDACKELGLKNPIPPTARSQDFRRASFIAPRYLRKSMGEKGDFGVLQSPRKSSFGHLTCLREDQKEQPYFLTVEYNTNGIGSRDGDGAYQQKRSTVDFSRRNNGKKFICFADVAQWVLDVNKAKIKLA